MKGLDPTELDTWMESRSRGSGIQDDYNISDLHVKDASSSDDQTLNGLDDSLRIEDQEAISGKSKKPKAAQEYYDPIRDVNNKFKKHKCLQFLKADNSPKQNVDRSQDVQSLKEKQAVNEKLKKQKNVQVLSASKLLKPTLNSPSDAFSSKEPQVEGDLRKQNIAHYLSSNNLVKVGTHVHMFCHELPKTIVAHGIVVDMIFAEQEEYPTYVKFYVEKALIPTTELLVPHDGSKTIGEVVHKCIAWELSNVMEMQR